MARMGRRFPLGNKCIPKDTIAKNAKRPPRRVAATSRPSPRCGDIANKGFNKYLKPFPSRLRGPAGHGSAAASAQTSVAVNIAPLTPAARMSGSTTVANLRMVCSCISCE
jgi:hypothetical protein